MPCGCRYHLNRTGRCATTIANEIPFSSPPFTLFALQETGSPS